MSTPDEQPGTTTADVAPLVRHRSGKAPPTSVRELWIRIRPFMAQNRRHLVLLAATNVVAGFAEAGVLLLIIQLAVGLSSGADALEVAIPLVGSTETSVAAVFWALVGLAVFRLALKVFMAWLVPHMRVRALEAQRKELFARFIEANWDIQAREQEGELQLLMTGKVIKAAESLTKLAQALTSATNFLTMLVAATVLNPFVAGVILFAVVLLFFVFRPLSTRTRDLARRVSEAETVYAREISQTVRLTQEVRVFDAGDSIRRRVDEAVDSTLAPLQRQQFLSKLLPALYQSVAILFLIGGLGTLHLVETDNLVSLSAVVLLLIRALTYSQNLQSTYQALMDIVPYAEVIQEARARYEANRVPVGGAPVERIGRLDFERVSYAYEPGTPVLEDVSFTVEPGEVIGVVGPSGAGKSTLVQILLRLRDPASGRFLVDGVEAAELDQSSWHQRVAFVPQDSRLLSDTVEANIRFFRSGLTPDDVERGARLAHIHDTIAGWRDGYATVVGERENAVSGGQRQRICLARALAGDPSVIILDEPTSALDAQSEAAIQASLESIKRSVTMFIIAHRLSTLKFCDRIMVFDEGRLTGFEPSTDLLESNAFYRRAFELSQLS